MDRKSTGDASVEKGTSVLENARPKNDRERFRDFRKTGHVHVARRLKQIRLGSGVHGRRRRSRSSSALGRVRSRARSTDPLVRAENDSKGDFVFWGFAGE